MKKTLLEVYALAVCFITIICFVVCLGIAGYSVVQVMKPDFTMRSYEYDKFQSNDAYWKSVRGYCSDKEKKDERPNEETLTRQRTEDFALNVHSEQRDGWQVLVKTLIIIVADALTFAFHWQIGKRARQTNLV